jgi:hypothetical protein
MSSATSEIEFSGARLMTVVVISSPTDFSVNAAPWVSKPRTMSRPEITPSRLRLSSVTGAAPIFRWTTILANSCIGISGWTVMTSWP